MTAYIITRFSILDDSKKFWRLARTSNNIETLKANLFSKERLDEKFKAFNFITYPSVINQTNQNFVWIIVTSKHLPTNYKSKLYKFKKPNIKIIEVGNMREFSRIINSFTYEKEYATVRLDDDDGLNINFIDKLNLVYKTSKKSEIFSLVNGRKATIEGNKIFISNKKTIYKNIALGLTWFNGNIYSAGMHKTIHERFEVIYDESPGMYLLYSSEFCDSKRKFNSETYSEESLKDFLIGEFFKKPAV
jgi:hypothetical protein